MAKFVVYEKMSELIYNNIDKSKLSNPQQTGVNLGAGLIAGFAAALVSQPADTMLSVINKTKGAPGEGTVTRLVKIAGELGLRGSYAGIGTRLFMVGGVSNSFTTLSNPSHHVKFADRSPQLTAGQFAIYGDIKKALGATGGVEIAK